MANVLFQEPALRCYLDTRTGVIVPGGGTPQDGNRVESWLDQDRDLGNAATVTTIKRPFVSTTNLPGAIGVLGRGGKCLALPTLGGVPIEIMALVVLPQSATTVQTIVNQAGNDGAPAWWLTVDPVARTVQAGIAVAGRRVEAVAQLAPITPQLVHLRFDLIAGRIETRVNGGPWSSTALGGVPDPVKGKIILLDAIIGGQPAPANDIWLGALALFDQPIADPVRDLCADYMLELLAPQIQPITIRVPVDQVTRIDLLAGALDPTLTDLMIDRVDQPTIGRVTVVDADLGTVDFDVSRAAAVSGLAEDQSMFLALDATQRTTSFAYDVVTEGFFRPLVRRNTCTIEIVVPAVGPLPYEGRGYGCGGPAGPTPANTKVQRPRVGVRNRIPHSGRLRAIGFELACNQSATENSGRQKSNDLRPASAARSWSAEASLYPDDGNGQPLLSRPLAGPMKFRYDGQRGDNGREMRLLTLKTKTGATTSIDVKAGQIVHTVVSNTQSDPGRDYFSLNGQAAGKLGTPPASRRAGPYYGDDLYHHRETASNSGKFQIRAGYHWSSSAVFLYEDGTLVAPAVRCGLDKSKIEIGKLLQVKQEWRQTDYRVDCRKVWFWVYWAKGKKPNQPLEIEIAERAGTTGDFAVLARLSMPADQIQDCEMGTAAANNFTQKDPPGFCDWISFTLGTPIQLVPGRQYRVVCSSRTNGNRYITYGQQKLDDRGFAHVYRDGRSTGANNASLAANINLWRGGRAHTFHPDRSWKPIKAFDNEDADYDLPIWFEGSVGKG